MPVPVNEDPLWSGAWSAKKFRATIINDIYPAVVFFSAVATMVSLVSAKTSHSLAVSNQMITVLGTVLGLVISFRTSTAYERYSEGRKLWTNIMLTSRNLAQYIWIHVPNERVNKGDQKAQSLLESVIEKKSMINLIQAFSVAVKHFLRGEPGIYYEDLYPLVSFLPRFATHPPAMQLDEDMLPLWRASGYSGTEPQREEVFPQEEGQIGSGERGSSSRNSWYKPFRNGDATTNGPRRVKSFDPEKALPVILTDKPLKPARNPPSVSFYDYVPIMRIFKPAHKLIHPHTTQDAGRTFMGRIRQPDLVDSNVPLEISLHLSSYFAWLLRCGLVQPAIATGINNCLTSLQDTISNLERIRNTPLPFAYQVHLRMTVWLYLFFLPFQIYSSFKYLTIPATAFAAFLLLGFLEIGQEIENPFNYDLNDLNLDHFCLCIQREMHEITAHASPDPATYIFSPWNQPFAPADRRDAEEMARDKTHAYWGRVYGEGNGDGEGIDGEGAYAEGVTSIRRTLLKNWKDVDGMTRHPSGRTF